MILVNGEPGSKLDAADRGLAYGDGVFRTLAVRRGRPHAWALHYRKLQRDCAALGIDCPAESLLSEELARAIPATGSCAAKIIVTRGAGARGYAPPPSGLPTRIVMVAPLPQHPAEYTAQGIAARVCTLRLSAQPALAGVKHLNRLENVMARAEWRDPAIAEGLMLDADGSVIGGTMSNLFLVERDGLVTPAIERCGVAGVTRERILAAAAREGLHTQVGEVSLERLMQATAVMVVNSLIGAWQIAELGERRWRPEPMVRHVRQWIDEAVD